ncbi:MAG: DUF190 domain-containing protein [Candidatus Krumholzibacteriia bacterium]|nr:DUF190 domain-containing protein [bacterium]MCB9513246.1 DUF190 domain-containing protein [Candidatus Latescibacterota bacterium]MCB9514710.1 DUF190 domain-containing protein [Candidatus Latescibacterota bacterium]
MDSRPRQGALLRIFIGESDRHAGKPLHRWLVEAAHAHGLAGATVLRGLEGFGAGGRVHRASILRLSEDLPLVVEIVDAEERIRSFLPRLDGVLRQGLVTVERVEILRAPAPDDA